MKLSVRHFQTGKTGWMRHVGRVAGTFLLGGAGGVLFWALSFPLPFMLGAIAAVSAASIAGLPTHAPQAVRAPMSTVIGAMLGASFSPQIVAGAGEWVLPLIALGLFVAASALSCMIFFRRVMGYDSRTAYFAGMPGGLVDMVAFADQFGADVRKVALVHAIRILLIVFTVPLGVQLVSGVDLSVTPPRPDSNAGTREVWMWLLPTLVLGAALGHVLRLPAKFILGPMIVSAVIHGAGWSDFALPTGLVIFAQVVIGTTLGARFAGTTGREFMQIVPGALGSVVILLTLTIIFAWGVAQLGGGSPVALILSYSPGGFAEMGLIAVSLGIDAAFVATHHVARLVYVGIGGILISRFAIDRKDNSPESSSK